jgi:hypothetical protein
MRDKSYVLKVLASFESLKDARFQEEIGNIKKALEEGQIDYAAKVLVEKLYAKDKSLTLSDLLAAMPQEGFDEPRRLIQEGSYRAAAYEISRLIEGGLGLWKPDENEKVIMHNFWAYYCG